MIYFDIGASTGKYCRIGLKEYSIIYAFEPCKQNFAKLHKSLGSEKNVVLMDAAVDLVDGERTFYESNYTNSSSLMKYDEKGRHAWKNVAGNPDLDSIASYQVRTVRLDTFMQEHGVGRIDFLKVDTQGNDLNVVKSLGDRIYDVSMVKMEVIVTGFELYVGQPSKEEVVDYMTSKGFSVGEVVRQSYDQEEHITFVRK